VARKRRRSLSLSRRAGKAMILSRRRFFHVAASVAALPLLSRRAGADAYPTRPVHVVVGFAPGGGADVLARILGKRLSEVLQQQVIVENVSGAGGMVGASRVARSPSDGYQVFVGSTADAINVTLYKRPLYDLRADLMPVVMIAEQPTMLLARPDFPAASLQEFIAYIKKNQDSIKFASAGVGSSGHLDCVCFNAAFGVNAVHVPYRGGGAAIQDLIACRLDYVCTLTGTAIPFVESKQVKSIAVFAPERVSILPDIPTAREQGFSDLEASTWFGFFVPRGTPAPVIERLHAATSEAIDTPWVQEHLLKSGTIVAAPERRSTEFLKQHVEKEIERNAVPIRAIGLSIE
jgi:tripartite-type tricarboxylate transporter receptor subunit TctC